MKTVTMERIYVKVTSDFDTTGYMQPRKIIWADGREFRIEAVRDFRPEGGARAGTDRYTVVVRGQERYLFFEKADRCQTCRVGRWYVESLKLETGDGQWKKSTRQST